MRYYDRPIARPAMVVAAALVDEAARLNRYDKPWMLLRRDRTRKLAYIRFGVIWVMRQLGIPFERIRDQLNFKDHTSVMYAQRMATKFRAEDPEYADWTDALLRFALSQRPLNMRSNPKPEVEAA